MSRKIPQPLKNATALRANYCCEYCRIAQLHFFYKFEIDHILSIRHGGLTVLENLALSCPDCNRRKGTDIGGYLGSPRKFVPLFNPRKDIWEEHFEEVESAFYPKTEIGEITIRLLHLNDPDRIITRQDISRFLPS